MVDIERAELLRTWVAALRSGKYRQGGGVCYREADGTHCVLGVLNDLVGASQWTYDGAVAVWGAGRWTDPSRHLFFLNDEGMSFSDLADTIESMFPDVFGEKVERGEGVGGAYLGADASALELAEATV